MEAEDLGYEGAYLGSQGQFPCVVDVGNIERCDGSCRVQLSINSKCDLLSLH